VIDFAKTGDPDSGLEVKFGEYIFDQAEREIDELECCF
jgi:hypothetical protein